MLKGSPQNGGPLTIQQVVPLWSFAHKRHTIYLRRKAGLPVKDWTDDPILQQYRFCNVYRELDTVTDWLRVNWREPNADDPDLWHAFVVARHMNNIPMLDALGGATLPWDRDRFVEIAEDRRLRGEQVFSGAYMIGTRHNGSKAVYLADMVFNPLWKARDKIRPLPGDTLNGFHMQLGLWYGLASFMSAQVIADVKYTGVLKEAKDWHSFCASGPGSRRGLNFVLGRKMNNPWTEDEFRLRVDDLRNMLAPRFEQEGWTPPDGQDTQNLLCEYGKYMKAVTGVGRPKQLFRGGNNTLQEDKRR